MVMDHLRRRNLRSDYSTDSDFCPILFAALEACLALKGLAREVFLLTGLVAATILSLFEKRMLRFYSDDNDFHLPRIACPLR